MSRKFIIGLLILCSCSPIAQDTNTNIATKGEIDLRNQDFHKAIPLKGEWTFDWENLNPPQLTTSTSQISQYATAKTSKPMKSFLRIGERWKNHFNGTGYATYQLKILFPEAAKKNIYALRFFQTGGAAMSVYVNGELELELGKVGTSKDLMIPTRSSGVVLLPHPNLETNILVHISNFYHDDGSFWYPPTLGSYKKINTQIFNEAIKDALLTGALIFMAFYHFTVFIFRRHKTIIFYFGLYSFIIALHSISLNGDSLYFLFPNVPYRLAFALSLIFFLAMPSYLLFLYQRFPENFSKPIITFFIISCTSLYIFVLITPSELGSQTTIYGISLTILALFYSIVCMIHAVYQKKDMAIPLLLIQFFLFLSAINDTLYLYGILNYFMILKYSYLSTVLFQSLVLASYFTKSFLKNEILGKELSLLNESLEKTVIIRTKEYKDAKRVAEEANQWKDKLISLVAHDLRSPLSTIYSALTIISDKNSTEEEKTHISKQVFVILENTMATVENLLNLNRFRLDQGQIHLHLSEIQLSEIIKPLADSFTFDLKKKSLQLEIEIPETTTVYAETSLLLEILRNLIANAIKFSHPNGWIKVSINHQQMFTEICIEDNGKGIPVERQKDLFSKPMTSLGTMGEKGFGIGLKLCIELMRLHGGSIHFQSEEGKGSKFILEFPNKT
ncbi:sensor histidine kinase [Leptospira sp. 2 VSF19]|uniref:histidine kinase n=1 Tax=Leptospira soteropolitanensis TaxID=2950025 RepID=A0AAW5VPW4_9LEPT|nr:sensor histidine kinase [Leptospira soteropolitanensis]MCW7494605.1 sensor histidine kinase [Leptospira soteropolitanensis]MCW7502227.1 sensor histidine kinase [Leptospira soteropolitanensis]MCW7524451.1 sensor histidine kinase [Leptospira soteropolitanensis]MCW7528317.1 sensor histidine kinase [Leptospira soteropolitanensis]MCW7532170.1 sensor histidine kinase [Leptospira soteropolitanensis]